MKREVMSIFLKFKFLGRGEVSYDKPEKREGMSILLTFIRTNQSTRSRVSCGQWACLLVTLFIAMTSMCNSTERLRLALRLKPIFN